MSFIFWEEMWNESKEESEVDSTKEYSYIN